MVEPTAEEYYRAQAACLQHDRPFPTCPQCRAIVAALAEQREQFATMEIPWDDKYLGDKSFIRGWHAGIKDTQRAIRGTDA